MLNYEKLYKDVKRQVELEYGWAKEQFDKTHSDYDLGMAAGYRMVIDLTRSLENIINYYENESKKE